MRRWVESWRSELVVEIESYSIRFGVASITASLICYFMVISDGDATYECNHVTSSWFRVEV